MTTSRYRPQKTAMIVAQRIVADIAEAGHRVGDLLPTEKQMVEDYRVGRPALRESLRFLELQGIIALKSGPGGGPRVCKPGASQLAASLTLLLQFEHAPFQAIVEARSALEPLMARLAASAISPQELSALIDSIDLMRDGLRDEQTFLQANRDFHEVVARASGNSMFGLLIEALLDLIDGTFLGVSYPLPSRTAVLHAHESILESLVAGDGDASEAAMAGHIGEMHRYLDRRFPAEMRSPITWGLSA